MILAGVDYSITSPAITVLNTETGEYKFFAFNQKKKSTAFSEPRLTLLEMPSWDTQEQRHYLLSTMLFEAAVGAFGRLDGAFLENYAYSASGQVFNIAEATGCFKQLLYRNGIPLETFQPTEVKKVATDKGGAKKDGMLKAFMEKDSDIYGWFGKVYGGEAKIPSPISDIVDSFFVLETGLVKNLIPTKKLVGHLSPTLQQAFTQI